MAQGIGDISHDIGSVTNSESHRYAGLLWDDEETESKNAYQNTLNQLGRSLVQNAQKIDRQTEGRYHINNTNFVNQTGINIKNQLKQMKKRPISSHAYLQESLFSRGSCEVQSNCNDNNKRISMQQWKCDQLIASSWIVDHNLNNTNNLISEKENTIPVQKGGRGGDQVRSKNETDQQSKVIHRIRAISIPCSKTHSELAETITGTISQGEDQLSTNLLNNSSRNGGGICQVEGGDTGIQQFKTILRNQGVTIGRSDQQKAVDSLQPNNQGNANGNNGLRNVKGGFLLPRFCTLQGGVRYQTHYMQSLQSFRAQNEGQQSEGEQENSIKISSASNDCQLDQSRRVRRSSMQEKQVDFRIHSKNSDDISEQNGTIHISNQIQKQRRLSYLQENMHGCSVQENSIEKSQQCVKNGNFVEKYEEIETRGKQKRLDLQRARRKADEGVTEEFKKQIAASLEKTNAQFIEQFTQQKKQKQSKVSSMFHRIINRNSLQIFSKPARVAGTPAEVQISFDFGIQKVPPTERGAHSEQQKENESIEIGQEKRQASRNGVVNIISSQQQLSQIRKRKPSSNYSISIDDNSDSIQVGGSASDQYDLSQGSQNNSNQMKHSNKLKRALSNIDTIGIGVIQDSAGQSEGVIRNDDIGYYKENIQEKEQFDKGSHSRNSVTCSKMHGYVYPGLLSQSKTQFYQSNSSCNSNGMLSNSSSSINNSSSSALMNSRKLATAGSNYLAHSQKLDQVASDKFVCVSGKTIEIVASKRGGGAGQGIKGKIPINALFERPVSHHGDQSSNLQLTRSILVEKKLNKNRLDLNSKTLKLEIDDFSNALQK